MNFETGSISFRMLELPRPLPDDLVEKLAAHRAGPLEAIGQHEQRGWVTGRHLLDTNITPESATYGGYIRMALRQAERKVPEALLKAECRAEELAIMAAEGKAYLKKKQRAEIREAVVERLLPNMPPTLRSIPFVYQPGTTFLFVSAVSDPQMDVFLAALSHSLGFGGSPSTPETIAETMECGDLRELAGSCFTTGAVQDSEPAPGREFLTWLWFISETNNGRISIPSWNEVGVMIEGPLTFVHEGTGAYSATLKKGLPQNSAEAKTCLLSGKKLKEAKIAFYLDEERQWHFGMEADKFVFRCMKLPTGEGKLDAISRFQDRMMNLNLWREIFMSIYINFLDSRTNKKIWSTTTKDIQNWIQSRPSRT